MENIKQGNKDGGQSKMLDFGNGMSFQQLGTDESGKPIISFNELLLSKQFTDNGDIRLDAVRNFMNKHNVTVTLEDTNQYLERDPKLQQSMNDNPYGTSQDFETINRAYRHLDTKAKKVPIQNVNRTGIAFIDSQTNPLSYSDVSDAALVRINKKKGYAHKPIGQDVQLFHEDQIASANKGYLNKDGQWVDDPELSSAKNDLVLDTDKTGNPFWREQKDHEWSRSADIRRYDWLGGDRTMGGSNYFGTVFRGAVQGALGTSIEGTGELVRFFAGLTGDVDDPTKWYNEFADKAHNVAAKLNRANKDEEDLNGAHGWIFGISSGIGQVATVMVPTYGFAAAGKLAGMAKLGSNIGKWGSMSVLSSAAAAADVNELKEFGFSNSDTRAAFAASFIINMLSEAVMTSALESPVKNAELKKLATERIREMLGKEGAEMVGDKTKAQLLMNGLKKAYDKLSYTRTGTVVKGMTDEAMEELYAAAGSWLWKEANNSWHVNNAQEHLDVLDRWNVEKRNGKYYKTNNATGEVSEASKEFYDQYNESLSQKGLYEKIVSEGGPWDKEGYSLDDIWKEMAIAGISAGPMGFFAPVAQRKNEKEKAIEQAFDELTDKKAEGRLRKAYERMQGTTFAPLSNFDNEGKPVPYGSPESQYEARWQGVRSEIDTYKMLITKYGLNNADVVRAIAGDKRIALEAVKALEERESLMTKEELTNEDEARIAEINAGIDYLIKPTENSKTLSNGEVVPVRFSEAVHDQFLESALSFEKYLDDIHQTDTKEVLTDIVGKASKEDLERANYLQVKYRDEMSKRIPAILRATANVEQLTAIMNKNRDLGSIELFKQNRDALREKYAKSIEEIRSANESLANSLEESIPLITEFGDLFEEAHTANRNAKAVERNLNESSSQLQKKQDALSDIQKEMDKLSDVRIANEEQQNDLNTKIEQERSQITDENRDEVEPRIQQMEKEVQTLRDEWANIDAQEKELSKSADEQRKVVDEHSLSHENLIAEHRQAVNDYKVKAAKLNDGKYDQAMSITSAATRMMGSQLGELQAQVDRINRIAEPYNEENPIGFEQEAPELSSSYYKMSNVRLDNTTVDGESNIDPTPEQVNEAKVKALFEHFTGIPYGSEGEMITRINNKQTLEKAQQGLAEMGLFIYQLQVQAEDIETNFSGKKKRINTKNYNNDVKEFSQIESQDLVSLAGHASIFQSAVETAAKEVNDTKKVIDSNRFKRNATMLTAQVHTLINLSISMGPDGFELKHCSLNRIKEQIGSFVKKHIDSSFDEKELNLNDAMRLIVDTYALDGTSDTVKAEAKALLTSIMVEVTNGRFDIAEQKDLFDDTYFKKLPEQAEIVIGKKFRNTSYEELGDYNDDNGRESSTLNLGTKNGEGMFSTSGADVEKSAAFAAMLSYIIPSLNVTKETFEELENTVKNGVDGDPAMTIEQLNIAVEAVGFFLNNKSMGMNANSTILPLVTTKTGPGRMFKSALMIRGFAGGGKTQVLMANVIKTINSIVGKAGGEPIKVTVVAPRIDVAKLSAETFGTDSVVTYHEFINGTVPLAEIYVMDEASLLAEQTLNQIKEKVDGNGTIFFIGDESQTPSSGTEVAQKGKGLEKYSQQCRKVAFRTTPIEETHRSALVIHKILFDYLRYGYNNPMINGEYTGNEENPESGLFFARSQSDVEKRFLNDKSSSKMIVFETETEANAFYELNKAHGISRDMVLSARFDISSPDSVCASGLSAEKVYVAIGSETVGTGTRNEIKNYKRMLYTAASRAKGNNALIVMYHSNAINSEKFSLSGSDTNIEEQQERNKAQKQETLDVLSAVNRNLPKAAEPAVAVVKEEVEETPIPEPVINVVEKQEPTVVPAKKRLLRRLTEYGKSKLVAHPSVAKLIDSIASAISWKGEVSLESKDSDFEHNAIVRFGLEMMLNPNYTYDHALSVIQSQVEKYNKTLAEGNGIQDPKAYAVSILKNGKLIDIARELRRTMDAGTVINNPMIASPTFNTTKSPLAVSVVGVTEDGKPVVRVIDVAIFNNEDYAKGYSQMTPDRTKEDGGMGDYARERYAAIVTGLQQLGAIVADVTVYPLSFTFDRGSHVGIHSPLVVEDISKLSLPSNSIAVEGYDESAQYDYQSEPTKEEKQEFENLTGANANHFYYDNGDGTISLMHLVTVNGQLHMENEDGSDMPMLRESMYPSILTNRKALYRFKSGAILNSNRQMVVGTNLREVKDGRANMDDNLSNADRKKRLDIIRIMAMAKNKPSIVSSYHQTYKTYSNVNGEDKEQRHAVVYHIEIGSLDSDTKKALADAGITEEWMKENPIAIESSPEYDFTGEYAKGKKIFSMFGEAVNSQKEAIFEKIMATDNNSEVNDLLDTLFEDAFISEEDADIRKALIDYNKAKILRMWDMKYNDSEYRITIESSNSGTPYGSGLTSMMEFEQNVNADGAVVVSHKPVQLLNGKYAIEVSRPGMESTFVHVQSAMLSDMSEDDRATILNSLKQDIATLKTIESDIENLVRSNGDKEDVMVKMAQAHEILDNNIMVGMLHKNIDRLESTFGLDRFSYFYLDHGADDTRRPNIRLLRTKDFKYSERLERLLPIAKEMQNKESKFESFIVPFNSSMEGREIMVSGQGIGMPDITGSYTMSKPSIVEAVSEDGYIDISSLTEDDMAESSFSSILNVNDYDRSYANPVDDFTQEQQDAIEELMDLIGKRMDPKHRIVFADDVFGVNGDKVYGKMKDLAIYLEQRDGKTSKRVLRHEAMHFIHSYLLNEKSKNAVLKELAQKHGTTNQNHLYEYLAEGFESNNVKPTSVLGKIVAAVKHLLAMFNLYSYTVNEVYKAANLGLFRISPVNNIGDELELYKKKDRYNAHNTLLKIFGSVERVKAAQGMIKRDLRIRSGIDSKIANTGVIDSSMGGAIYNTINQYSNSIANVKNRLEYLKRNNKKPSPTDLSLYVRADLGNAKVTLKDGSVTSIKDVSFEELSGVQNENTAKNFYMRYHMSNPLVIKSLIQTVFPGVNIDVVVDDYRDKKKRNSMESDQVSGKAQGAITRNVIQGEMDSNEKKSIAESLSPYIAFMLDTIKVRNNRLNYDTRSIKVADGKTFHDLVENGKDAPVASFSAIKSSLYQAGLNTSSSLSAVSLSTMEPESVIDTFFNEVENIAKTSSGTVGAFLRSFLIEYGNISYNVDETWDFNRWPGGLMSIVNPKSRKAVLEKISTFRNSKGMAISPKDIERIKEQSTIKAKNLLRDFIVPLVNHFTGVASINLAIVVNRNGELSYVANETSDKASIKASVAQSIAGSILGDDGLLSDQGIALAKKITVNDTSLLHNGKMLASGKTLTIPATTTADDIYNFLTEVGINVSQKTVEDILNAARSSNPLMINAYGKTGNSKGEFTLEKLAEELHAIAMAIKVNGMVQDDMLNDSELESGKGKTMQKMLRSATTVQYGKLNKLYSKMNYKMVSPYEAVNGEPGRAEYPYSEGVVVADFTIPSPSQHFVFLKALAEIESNSLGTGYEMAKKNVNDDTIQRFVKSSLIMDMFQFGSDKVLNSLNKVRNGMLKASKEATVTGAVESRKDANERIRNTFRAARNFVKKSIIHTLDGKLLSILENNDDHYQAVIRYVDYWGGEKGVFKGVEFASQSPASLFKTLFEGGFWNRMLEGKKGHIFPLDQIADKTKMNLVNMAFNYTRKNNANMNEEVGLISVDKKNGKYEATVNVPVVVSMMKQTAKRYANIQRLSIVRWATELNRVAPSEAMAVLAEGVFVSYDLLKRPAGELSLIKKVFDSLKPEDQKAVVNNLSKNLDYVKGKNGYELGNGTLLNAKHTMFNDKFVYGLLNATNTSQAMSFLRESAQEKYEAFAVYMTESGYKMSGNIRNLLSSNRVDYSELDAYKQKIWDGFWKEELTAENPAYITKDGQEVRVTQDVYNSLSKEEKSSLFSVTVDGVAEETPFARRYKEVKDYINGESKLMYSIYKSRALFENPSLYDSIDDNGKGKLVEKGTNTGKVNKNGDPILTKKEKQLYGMKTWEDLLAMSRNERNAFFLQNPRLKAAFKAESKRKYTKATMTDISSFIDEVGNWNPATEAYFWGTLLTNSEVNAHTQGSELDTKDIVDYFKRNAGVNAPGDIGVNDIRTMPKQGRVLVMDMGGAKHPYATEMTPEGRKQVFDSENRANGLGYLNPVMKILMVRAFGRVNGPVGNAMVKPVLSYFDYDLGFGVYMKQAMRHITGTTIQMSNQDLFLLRTMLGETLWKEYGDQIRDVANGSDASKFDSIMGRIADSLEVDDMVDYSSMSEAEKLEHEQRMAKREKYMSEMLFQVIDPSAVKRGLHKVHKYEVAVGEDGKRDAFDPSFEVLNAKGDTFDNAISVDLSRMRIQLNVEQDVNDTDKNMAVQLKHMLGVIDSENNRYVVNRVNSLMEKMQNLNLGKMSKDGSSVSDSVKNGILKAVMKRANLNESLRDYKIMSIPKLNLALIRSKGISGYFSELNKALKPKMNGNTYAQATMDVDLYEDQETGRIYFKNELSAVHQERVGKLKKRKLQPMRYGINTENGMVYLEPTLDANGIVVESVGEKVDRILKLRKDESISGADLGLNANNVVRNMLVTIPGDCIMPFSYFSQFFPKGTKPMSLNQCIDWLTNNRPELLEEFNKTLTVMSVRIPVSNASLASVNRIVGFINDMGNTYIMASEKNIIDGADQDIDTIHVYFKALDKNSMKKVEPLSEQDDLNVDKEGQLENDEDYELPYASVPSDEESVQGLQNLILDQYVSFLLDPANHEMSMRANSMDTLKEKAENSDVKNDNHYANEIGSSIHAKEINHDGKDVGFFADAQATFAATASLVNAIGADVVLKRNIISPVYDLFFSPLNHMRADAIDWLGKLINAATDNAKNNFLGRLNMNKRNSSVVLGATASGMSEDQIFVLLNGAIGEDEDAISVAYEIDRKMKESNTIDGFPKPIYTTAASMVSEVNKRKSWDSLKVEMGVSSVLDLFDPAILAEKEISIANATDGVRLFIAEMSKRGEALIRYKAIQKFVENVPVHTYDLKVAFRNIENSVGMPMENFISLVERIARNNDILDAANKPDENRNISKELAFVLSRNSNISSTDEKEIRELVDIPMLLSYQPSVFNSLKRIYDGYNATKDATITDRLANRIADKVEAHIGRSIQNADAHKAIENEAERMVIGMALSNETVTVDGVEYNLQNGFDRAKFYYSFPDFVTKWKSQNRNNEFLNRLTADKQRGDMKEVGLRSSIGLDPISKGVLFEAYRQLDEEVRNAFMVYNLLRYGITTAKDSMSEVIGIDYEKKLSTFMTYMDNYPDSELNKLVEQFAYVAIANHPDILTNKMGKVIKSDKDINEKTGKRSAYTFMSNGYGKPNSTINLRYGQMNAYGVDGPLLVRDAGRIWKISMDDAIAVHEKGKATREKSSVVKLLNLKGRSRKFTTVLGDVVSVSELGKNGYSMELESISTTNLGDSKELEVIACKL